MDSKRNRIRLLCTIASRTAMHDINVASIEAEQSTSDGLICPERVTEALYEFGGYEHD